MKRSLLALMAIIALTSGSGCCCVERFFCYGLCDGGPWGPSYGHEGPFARCGYFNGPCADCRNVGREDFGGPGALAEPDLYEQVPSPAPSAVPPAEENPLERESEEEIEREELNPGPLENRTGSHGTNQDIPEELARDLLDGVEQASYGDMPPPARLRRTVEDHGGTIDGPPVANLRRFGSPIRRAKLRKLSNTE